MLKFTIERYFDYLGDYLRDGTYRYAVEDAIFCKAHMQIGFLKVQLPYQLPFIMPLSKEPEPLVA